MNKNKVVLICDDDSRILPVMKTVFSEEGYNVIIATDGE